MRRLCAVAVARREVKEGGGGAAETDEKAALLEKQPEPKEKEKKKCGCFGGPPDFRVVGLYRGSAAGRTSSSCCAARTA